MSLNKPIKFVRLQKLAKQSILSGAITKTLAVILLKVKKSLAV